MDWNKYKEEIDSKQNDGTSLYFKIIVGESDLRIVSEPLQVWKSFNPKPVRVYLTEEAAKKDKDAKPKWMMWVINRKTQEIQIAEFGTMIWKQLVNLATSKNSGFSELPPYDMTLKRVGEDMETEYFLEAHRADTALTQEEMDKINQLKPIIDIVINDALDADAYRASIIPF